jgi:hypothetical protein
LQGSEITRPFASFTSKTTGCRCYPTAADDLRAIQLLLAHGANKLTLRGPVLLATAHGGCRCTAALQAGSSGVQSSY